ncbi:MAG TPA: hypothetical protein VMU12_01285 [Candidatus Paceibacterota bacterium]|nr:hypothetical protein [Candidatus Paceibacterota bacterium]
MRIKPWLLTGAVAVSAAVAAGIIIAANDPATTTTPLRILFWIALILGLWGVTATVLQIVRMNLAQATWDAFVLTAGTVASILLRRAGYRDHRLLGGLILATLLLSFLFWWRLRHAR